MTLPVEALKACRLCADIANSILKQLKPDDPRRQWIPALRDLLDAEISMARARQDSASSAAYWEGTDELLNAAQTAEITGIPKRTIQRKAKDGSLEAQLVAGRWLFRRTTVEEYADNAHP